MAMVFCEVWGVLKLEVYLGGVATNVQGLEYLSLSVTLLIAEVTKVHYLRLNQLFHMIYS